MSDLPPLFLERMARLFGADQAGFASLNTAYAKNSGSGLRLNTLKLSPAEFASLQSLGPLAAYPVDWCPEGLLLAASPDAEQPSLPPGKHPYHQAGLYYLQDVAAMAPVALMDPQPGERILDLAAAPGGKSTQIAARLQGRGLLLANEIHPKRVWDLAENLERFGAANAVITQETPERLAAHFGAWFDRVVLDAPCSGEGMFHKSAAARQAWSPELVQGCALRQVDILRQAARLVRPGGWLVYSTCTLSPEENEGTLASFLSQPILTAPGQNVPQFELAAAPLRAAHPQSFAPGRPDWLAPPPNSAGLGLEQALRLWPQRPSDGPASYASLGLTAGDGHFCALLHRVDDGQAPEHAPWQPGLSKDARSVLSRFLQDTLSHSAATGLLARPLLQQGQYLYALPEDLPNLGGLKTIHHGLWLGQLKTERFEPSHALALALSPVEDLQTLPLPAASPQLAAYLRGETLPAPGPDGWTLVCVDGRFPIGWAKRSQGVLKNFYPKGLRR